MIGNSCDILDKAIVRYQHIISGQLRKVRARVTNVPFDNKWRNVPEFLGHLDSLKVDLKASCEKLPYLGMDESCKNPKLAIKATNSMSYLSDELTVSQSEATLQSFTIWGALRGLESFSQLLYVAPDARSVKQNITVRC